MWIKRSLFSMNGPDSEFDQHGQRRIVSKKGIVHTERARVSKQRRRYLSDFFNTMLDIQWRYVLLIFTLSFFVRWLPFCKILKNCFINLKSYSFVFVQLVCFCHCVVADHVVTTWLWARTSVGWRTNRVRLGSLCLGSQGFCRGLLVQV